MINNEKKYNINENKIEIKAIKDEVKKLKIEYENELVKYKNASRNIIETEEKFNNISKKINKIKYKQMILTNKITNEYIDNLNNYKLESNIKVTILSLLGFPFPNDEPFYFTSPEDLIAQLSLSKEFLFNLVLTKKYEFDIIKSSYDTLNKNILVLRPIYDYMKLNFDIINLMQKREIIFEENTKWTQSKDNSLINVKTLEKKIKEKYSLMKTKIKSSNNTQKISISKNKNENNIDKNEKGFDELLNDSHLLSIKNFDEISGKSLMMSVDNDKSILDLFNEEDINNFEIEPKNINHKNYFNDNLQTFNRNTYSNQNKINILNKGLQERNEKNSPDMLKKMQDTNNTNIFTEEEEEKEINNVIHEKNKLFIKKYRSPQSKGNKERDILRIEKSVGDSGCCASCT